ncbi:MAG TPA: UDP-N-acetylmuramoyl-tripeptide--D-alanyl-D-alanine ligase [Mycobacteriales bacterium]|jgi:UDP-N-acetylmuramoyl-tripeptide--D-alanyl-D-alanine ligase|nr:UDP-N-acetylmuramoyl-tripeptide--D-alanyl-D-alanine ligase [Mycobacteriales bacterium]
MIPLSLADIAAATGGRLHSAEPARMVTTTVVVDSRLVEPGSLFVCVPGERVDGHDFARDAVDAGAVVVLAQREVDAPAVIVDDTVAALGRLASVVLGQLPDCRVVGVTGSSGKTSTKDLLGEVYSRRGPAVAPIGSFNNEVGFPLTVLRCDQGTRTLVSEYGARGRGHISYLCGIARPRTALVLNVGAAHLGEFGSREAIAEAKGELVEALPHDGVAVLNADDTLVFAMRSRTDAAVVTFGIDNDADVRVTELSVDDLARPRFTLHTPWGEATLQLQLHGRHHAANAAAVAAAALHDGVPFADVIDALESSTARSAHRMAVMQRQDGLVVIDDAYNANPESTRAAVDALVRLCAPERRRSWAVLGEMRELGPDATQLHVEVGGYAATAGVDEIVAFGAAAPIADGASAVPGWSGRARVVDDKAQATRIVLGETGSRDVVLVKASNSIQAWSVAEALVAAAGAEVRA